MGKVTETDCAVRVLMVLDAVWPDGTCLCAPVCGIPPRAEGSTLHHVNHAAVWLSRSPYSEERMATDSPSAPTPPCEFRLLTQARLRFLNHVCLCQLVHRIQQNIPTIRHFLKSRLNC